MGSVFDEVVGPDVVRPLGAQAHARAVVQPEAAALWLFLRDFQPLPSPDPLDPFGVHSPAGVAQQGRDPPVGDYHDRAPVILEPSDWQVWLDPNQSAAELMSMVRPERFELRPAA